MTPLDYATRFRHDEIKRLLLDQGAIPLHDRVMPTPSNQDQVMIPRLSISEHTSRSIPQESATKEKKKKSFGFRNPFKSSRSFGTAPSVDEDSSQQDVEDDVSQVLHVALKEAEQLVETLQSQVTAMQTEKVNFLFFSS